MQSPRIVCGGALLSLAAFILLLPGVSAAQDIQVGVRPADTNNLNESSSLIQFAGLNTDFSMKPSVTTAKLSPYGIGPQTLDLVLFCFNPATGVILPNCDVQVVPKAVSGSGGHVHNTNRPAGTFKPDRGNTGSGGFLPVTYTAPEASGITSSTITGSLSGVPVAPGTFTIGVEIDGLQRASGTGLIIDSTSNMHDSNNGFGTADMVSSIQDIPGNFSDRLKQAGINTAPAVQFTAMSLPFGGLFDFQVEWKPPHKSHRFGDDGDIAIRTLTRAQRTALAWAILNSGFSMPVPGERPQDPESTHWHIRLN
jgi:hypothetical protein